MSAIPERPLLVVDVDGVLNPYGPECPGGYTEHRLFPEDEMPVRICTHHGPWLRELSRSFDLIWGTAWREDERARLSGLLDLPPFHGAVELPRGQFDAALKIPAIDRIGENRPLAWIDDLLSPAAWVWAESRTAPTLLVPVDPALGLTRRHVTMLLGWASSLRA
jgi:hypothetical protein